MSTRVEPVPRPSEVRAREPKQRPRNYVVKPLEKYYEDLGFRPNVSLDREGLLFSHPGTFEDNLYQTAHVGRIQTEMVRPCVSGKHCSGWTYEKLRVAGLARSIQTKLYLHSCSPKYCLHNRSTCRFFFPWPEPGICLDLNVNAFSTSWIPLGQTLLPS